ncbi:MAG: hypothetical protein U9R38_01555 [Candidatus Margulisiibacteriota bacterium]|nr:hypothetical protein [Candidatus Margulisiibacteriota bacterium]
MKKERQLKIEFNLEAKTIINGIRVNKKTGIIEAFHDGEKIPFKKMTVSSQHKRKKSPKTLFKISSNNIIDFNAVINLLSFDYIFAVDTNTQTIGNEHISVTSVIQCIINENIAEYRPFASCTFKNAKKNAEIFGWKAWIDLLLKYPEFKKGSKVALIVDSNYDKIESYNTQQIPLFDDFFLPNNFILIYASADKKNESLANKLIARADRESTRTIKNIQKNHKAG